ncbi:hypothetical protein DPEC_G00214220 [Dallia pectoralis]|uniref:Uncharacterized protein n=1 Tax=Dallia pectoralis TaxID=75939 RepID=A0ACC2G1X5_DALPE|nr:hypothetical protein DPEC_G00214220 [Dallia pectoralis]
MAGVQDPGMAGTPQDQQGVQRDPPEHMAMATTVEAVDWIVQPLALCHLNGPESGYWCQEEWLSEAVHQQKWHGYYYTKLDTGAQRPGKTWKDEGLTGDHGIFHPKDI